MPKIVDTDRRHGERLERLCKHCGGTPETTDFRPGNASCCKRCAAKRVNENTRLRELGTPRVHPSRLPLQIGDVVACGSCGTPKVFTYENFTPAKNCRFGLSRTCRDCERLYRKTWLVRNKVGAGARRRELYASDPKVVEAMRKRAEWKACPFRRKAAVMARGIRGRCLRDGIPVDLDIFTLKNMRDWLTRQSTCECCGVRFEYDADGPWCNASPSVDRFYPAHGYTRGNVSLICWRCNNLKRDASADELDRVVRWMRAREAAYSPEASKFEGAA